MSSQSATAPETAATPVSSVSDVSVSVSANRPASNSSSNNLYMKTAKKMTHTIDAGGKALGRVAAEAAKALMGKMSPDYTPNILSDVRVTVTNASKMTK